MTTAITSARRTLTLEGQAILEVATRLDHRFDEAVDLLAQAGRVILSGIGKSGVIAQKIAATLTSTGTTATWVHPVDSLHGDLGLVQPDAVAILLSKSGETEELFGLLDALARMGVPIIALTGAVESTLGRASRVALDTAVREEACPHDLAPTTSTTVALAMGDALAVALLERKGFRREDFAALHPGGALGRRLLLRTRDVMIAADHLLPVNVTMRGVVEVLARARGLAILTRGTEVAGVITAGDLTRIAERESNYLDLPAESLMTRHPCVVQADDLASASLGELERHAIMAAPVLDGAGKIVGVVHLHDLLRGGAR